VVARDTTSLFAALDVLTGVVIGGPTQAPQVSNRSLICLVRVQPVASANWFNPSIAHQCLCSSIAVSRLAYQRSCNNHAIALRGDGNPRRKLHAMTTANPLHQIPLPAGAVLVDGWNDTHTPTPFRFFRGVTADRRSPTP